MSRENDPLFSKAFLIFSQYLKLVHGQGKGEHEGVPQSVNLLEDGDVGHQRLVPQVTQ